MTPNAIPPNTPASSGPATTLASPTIDYELPAATPAERIERLETVVMQLKESCTFAGAQLVCLNCRYAWDGVFGAWRGLGENRRLLIKRFVASMKLGRMFLSMVQPQLEEESRLLPSYMRSCTRRWEWGRLLLETEDLDFVATQMNNFVERELSLHTNR